MSFGYRDGGDGHKNRTSCAHMRIRSHACKAVRVALLRLLRASSESSNADRGSPLPSQQPQSTEPLVEAIPETPFYIPAIGTSARPRRSLKHGDCFAVLDSFGDVGASSGGPDGIFYCDTRHLGQLELLINGMQPLLLGSNVRDDNSMLTVDLTNPDFYFDDRLVLPKDTLHIVRTLFLWRATAYQRIRIRNHGDRAAHISLSLGFGSDFADLFEVRGLRRARRGRASVTVRAANEAVLTYQGLDGKLRRTELTFTPAPEQLSNTEALYPLELALGESHTIYILVECCAGAVECHSLPFQKGIRAAFREHRAATQRRTTVATSNVLFNEVLCRAMADISMLTTATPQGSYPYAGIPWYSTTFGRDGIITALQMLWCDSRLARGVLRRLAAYQATDYDSLADAEPGKILHEMRGGEMAALREVPVGLYYGSVDSTPLFVLLAGMDAEHTGDLKTLRELWPNVEAALAWIDGPGDPDGDGFVEYHRADEKGLV